jgi:SAM-dependent methyltransferase
MNTIYKIRCKCSSCDSSNLSTIISLGEIPLAGHFPTSPEFSTKFNLNLLLCEDCKLVQTDSIINADYLFKDYRYSSSVGLSAHFKQYAIDLNNLYDISNKNILEFGSNDGTLLYYLKEFGANVLGVDPAENIIKLADDKGLTTFSGYFNTANFCIDTYKNKFDVIIGNNVFAHIDDINDVVRAIDYCLSNSGKFIFEVHYLKNLILENQWDNIYHEHIYYYSITSLNNLFNKYNLYISNVDEVSSHSGSIRVTVDKHNSNSKLVDDMIEAEILLYSNEIPKFKTNYIQNIKHIKNYILELKSKGFTLGGYGASGRANMFCNIIGLNDSIIDFIVDESLERQNRYIADCKIPIITYEEFQKKSIDYLIIFAWNYVKLIVNKTSDQDYNYIIFFPEIKSFTKSELQTLTFNSL